MFCLACAAGVLNKANILSCKHYHTFCTDCAIGVTEDMRGEVSKEHCPFCTLRIIPEDEAVDYMLQKYYSGDWEALRNEIRENFSDIESLMEYNRGEKK